MADRECVTIEAAAPGAGRAVGSLLRRARELCAVPVPPDAEDVARRARDRLDRDLLPRTAGEGPYLVAGIVGPNNAGKSALFNALVGAALSPSVPTGGATRRLVGAAHPELARALRDDPATGRFPIDRVPAAGGRPLDRALEAGDEPARLMLAEVESLPTSVLLIDTPDFDSVLAANRSASESLLAVADLAIVVVTRHTYQNREVVAHLERWLAHGRPWLLVYNEASDAATARAHAAKLADDVGSAPLGAWYAPHSLGVQRGSEPLEPRALEARGRTLCDELFDDERAAELKRLALAASLAQLGDDLGAIAAALARDARAREDFLAAARERARAAGARVAARAMPGGPFLEAFREVLDRRSNALSRGWRAGLRSVRARLESLPRLARRRPRESPAEKAEAALVAVERDRLREEWGALWESLARDLGPEGRDPSRAALSESVRAVVDEALAPGQGTSARRRALEGLERAPVETEEFRAFCEGLVERAIAERGFDWDVQAAADLATIAPIAIATAVIVKTGGLGADVGVAGGGAVATFLMEKYLHVLGGRIVTEARKRWSELRGAALADVILDAVFEEGLALVTEEARGSAERARAIQALRGELA